MKLRNRKGSTLALTIIIFAVLMIFATFTMGFMVTENKQSIYYQNKTQAHHLAVSGVDIVSVALIDQLSSYGNDVTGINTFLEAYKNDGFDLVVEVGDNNVDINVRYGKISNEAPNNVLIVEGHSSFRNVNQSVKRVIFSTATTVSYNNEEVTFEGDGQFLIYKNSAKLHHNQTPDGGGNIPEGYAKKASQSQIDSFVVQEFEQIDWENFDISAISKPGVDYIELFDPSKLNYGEVGKVTNVYVNGDLNLNSTMLDFYGEVNLYIKGSMNIGSSVTINSDRVDGKYLLNTYVYNMDENTNSLTIATSGGDKVSDVNLTGNIFTNYADLYDDGDVVVQKSGDIFMYFHQNSFINGNIMYNGTGDLRLKTHPNNLNALSKLISGSMYAPYGDVILGDSTDKVAFVIDGVIFADNIEIFAKNNAQASKFLSASSSSNIGVLPIITNNPTQEVTGIAFGSYYTD